MKRSTVPALAVCVALALSAACVGNINPDRQLGDAVLSTRVLEALDGDPQLTRYDLVVDTNGDVVTLLGEVPSAELRARAESIASNVDGVARVVNQIRVSN